MQTDIFGVTLYLVSAGVLPSVRQISSFNNMNGSEKLCLQWNDFQENITSTFKELREDTELTDVTLACEDGQQIETHKVVLASSSPFFMELLKKNEHPHPLIYRVSGQKI